MRAGAALTVAWAGRAEGAATTPSGGSSMSTAAPGSSPLALATRPIPHGQEALPVIGLGTWQTFDVGDDAGARAPLRAVLDGLLAAGARVIDSSPMYDRAEGVVGDLLAARSAGGPRTSPVAGASPFLATKVWTSGRAAGEAQMRRSLKLMRTERLDLLQVHNLVDWKTHLDTLRAWKQQGLVRYIGVTHYQLGAFAELERIVAREGIDFVQLPYSLATRAAEARLLPAAAAAGVAVLVMRPFEEGELFARVRGQALPPWAADIDCQSWAQLFLKFILAHPAVTCPIPATANPRHLADNLGAGRGRLPDQATRKKMIALLEG
jgi:diketogulonate reductase-like aldo/keto reductase